MASFSLKCFKYSSNISEEAQKMEKNLPLSVNVFQSLCLLIKYRLSSNLFVTCFHEFRIYGFFFTFYFYFILKQGRILLLR